MKIYKHIVASDWSWQDLGDNSEIYVSTKYKQIGIGSRVTDSTIIKEMVLNVLGKSSHRALKSKGDFEKAVVEGSVNRFLMAKLGVQPDIIMPQNFSERDIALFAVSNALDTDRLSALGIDPASISLLSKVIEVLQPTDDKLPPINRLKTSAFVLNNIYPLEASTPSSKGAPNPDTKDKSESNSPEGSSENDSDEEEQEDEEEDDEKEQEDKEAKKDSKKGTPETSDDDEEEKRRKTKEALEKLVKERKEKDERLADIKSELSRKTTPKPQKATNPVKASPSSIVRVDENDSRIDEEDTAFEDTYSHYTDNGFAKMKLIYPALTGYIKATGFSSKRTSEYGCVPLRFTDPASGKYFFERGKSLGFTRGGTILVDYSGSTAFTEDMLQSLVKNFPLATIALYSAPYVRAKDGYTGACVIIAKNSRVVTKFKRADYFRGSQNAVDGPALEWLSRQRAPRIFISDLGLTGIGDCYLPADLHRKTLSRIIDNGIITIAYSAAQSSFMNEGKINNKLWQENTKIIRNHYRYYKLDTSYNPNSHKDFVSKVVCN